MKLSPSSRLWPLVHSVSVQRGQSLYIRPTHDVLEIDTWAGIVEALRRDPRGRVLEWEEGRPLVERLHGSVSIEWRVTLRGLLRFIAPRAARSILHRQDARRFAADYPRPVVDRIKSALHEDRQRMERSRGTKG